MLVLSTSRSVSYDNVTTMKIKVIISDHGNVFEDNFCTELRKAGAPWHILITAGLNFFENMNIYIYEYFFDNPSFSCFFLGTLFGTWLCCFQVFRHLAARSTDRTRPSHTFPGQMPSGGGSHPSHPICCGSVQTAFSQLSFHTTVLSCEPDSILQIFTVSLGYYFRLCGRYTTLSPNLCLVSIASSCFDTKNPFEHLWYKIRFLT